VAFEPLTASPFQQLKEISRTLLVGSERQARTDFIRFLDRFDGSSPLTPAVDSLAVEFGLFPYILSSPERLSERDAVALAYHSPEVLHASGFTFHAEQQRVYERLMDGENLVLSAPTSFGKSVIIDALVSTGKWEQIVLIVPTIALIDETRRRLADLRSDYTIVSSTQQLRGAKNIFVLTQERFLELNPPPEVDFFVIDEFYKLGSREGDDSRRSTLNIAWRQLRNTGAQFYLIGPNIDSVDDQVDPEVRDALYVSDYNTVVVDVEDRSGLPDDERLADLQSFLENDADGPSLIFVSAVGRAHAMALDIATGTDDSLVLEIAQWIADNYDPEWVVARALSLGVGTHTGPMPRSLQRAMIRLFSQRRIDRLVCTSTLIEGVNTVAKNVVIYDKKIDKKPIDFFTFSNIRGRAGRMLKHFVGRVISYAPQPDTEQSEVDIPIESQSRLASLATLVQLDRDELTPESLKRLSDVLSQNVLSLETIRANRGIDPMRQVDVAKSLFESSAADFVNFSWSGLPRYEQLQSVLTLGYNDLLQGQERRGIGANQLAARVSAIRGAAGDIPAMIQNQMRFKRDNQSRSDIVDDVLSFQRSWMEFKIPSMLRAISSIQHEVAAGRPGARQSNFEFAIREIESLYLPPFIAELENWGLPLPISLKLSRLGLRGGTIEEVVARLAEMARDPSILKQLSRAERWFLSDVAQGLSREMIPVTDLV
jgi:hypothetical protein